ncbi:hypothetical protein QQS21_000490 [Conoideocrella luteorostrata]|uniref:Uncharacterized protein n=1 Tax=Conoideocrella luteorostrata TaxID=1105319 RepID=A0AAJ0CZ15_9HYPO|nr:hypothetical protein QQS21_000490 [Conoideocrella luteorostrata]
MNTVESRVAGVSWTGEVLPGRTFTFKGTIQEIDQQIKAVNPNYEMESTNANITDADSESHLEKRWRVKQEPDCDYGDDWADKTIVATQINWLKKGDKTCSAPQGPGGCARVSCDKRVGIWLCNDVDWHEIAMPCAEVAKAALSLIDRCWITQSSGWNGARGQLFTNADWNVIVGKAGC